VNDPAQGYHQHMLKRDLPVTVCTECGAAGYERRVIDGRCCKTIDEGRCNGANASAMQDGDWEECSYCEATGYYRNKECPRCKGVGYRFVRPGWRVAIDGTVFQRP
jgi:DnaJ-class molecular chaperone